MQATSLGLWKMLILADHIYFKGAKKIHILQVHGGAWNDAWVAWLEFSFLISQVTSIWGSHLYELVYPSLTPTFHRHLM